MRKISAEVRVKIEARCKGCEHCVGVMSFGGGFRTLGCLKSEFDGEDHLAGKLYRSIYTMGLCPEARGVIDELYSTTKHFEREHKELRVS